MNEVLISAACVIFGFGLGCGSTKADVPLAKQTTAIFDLSRLSGEHFFDAPFPSDARMTSDGRLDLAGFPNPRGFAIVSDVVKVAGERRGVSVLPVVYFRFDGPLKTRSSTEVIPAAVASPVLLIDVDEQSPERGKLLPTVGYVTTDDPYMQEGTLAVAPVPGIVLHPHRRYAVVVRANLGDVNGRPLAPSDAWTKIEGAAVPDGYASWNAAFKSAVDTLQALRITDVVHATVFTTGDEVLESNKLSDRVRSTNTVSFQDLAVSATANPAVCLLRATVSMPQYQRGKPPFATEGLFQIGSDGNLIEQRRESVKVVLALPSQPMPASGFPVVAYFHGSGGVASELIDGGHKEGEEPDSVWPGEVLVPRGFAMMGAALPLSPDRYPGAADTEYLNLGNPMAMRDTFRQGVIEQRLLFDALERLEIDAAAVSSCAGLLPGIDGKVRFDFARFTVQGQSMGGMYANLISAVEPRVRALVPTGAGGHWTYFILQTQIVPNAKGLLGVIVGTPEPLTFMHPLLSLIAHAWEPIDPVANAPRLARWPLKDHPARSIYAPVGEGDSYFPTVDYDAMAIASGNDLAGEVVWPSMQSAIKLDDRGEPRAYPVAGNRVSSDGRAFTGVVAQYRADGSYDSHGIYRRRADVMRQFYCFHRSFHTTGVATVVAPKPIASDERCE